jgi:adenosylcobinamide-GDP ribazoletransferase
MKKIDLGLRSAITTLTIFPFFGKDTSDFTKSLYWFVPVGILLGFIASFVALFFTHFKFYFIGATIVVSLLVFLTRAFHLDGVADMADGFGGLWSDKGRILAIMKESTIGSFGVIATILLLITKVAAVTTLLEKQQSLLLVWPILLSRLMAVFQIVFNRYAKEEGGTASHLVINSKIRHLIISLLTTVLFYVIYPNIPILKLVLTLFFGLLVTLYIALKARKKLGGITGDIIGSTVEYCETVMLLVVAF